MYSPVHRGDFQHIQLETNTLLVNMPWYTFLTLVVLLLVSSRTVEAGYEKTCSPEKLNEGPASRGMCGKRLSDTISLFCSFNFSMRKRGEMLAVPSLKSVIANKREAMDYLSKRDGFGRVGVVCECCYHRCSMGEIQEYCIPKKRSLQLPSKALGRPGDQSGMMTADQWLP